MSYKTDTKKTTKQNNDKNKYFRIWKKETTCDKIGYRINTVTRI